MSRLVSRIVPTCWYAHTFSRCSFMLSKTPMLVCLLAAHPLICLLLPLCPRVCLFACVLYLLIQFCVWLLFLCHSPSLASCAFCFLAVWAAYHRNKKALPAGIVVLGIYFYQVSAYLTGICFPGISLSCKGNYSCKQACGSLPSSLRHQRLVLQLFCNKPNTHRDQSCKKNL